MTQVLNDISPPPAAAPLRAALTEATRRCGFSPEALEALDRTIEDVYRELVDEGVADDRTLAHKACAQADCLCLQRPWRSPGKAAPAQDVPQ